MTYSVPTKKQGLSAQEFARRAKQARSLMREPTREALAARERMKKIEREAAP